MLFMQKTTLTTLTLSCAVLALAGCNNTQSTEHTQPHSTAQIKANSHHQVKQAHGAKPSLRRIATKI